jgi:hypothetical protein
MEVWKKKFYVEIMISFYLSISSTTISSEGSRRSVSYYNLLSIVSWFISLEPFKYCLVVYVIRTF